jgi:hypothetical protein
MGVFPHHGTLEIERATDDMLLIACMRLMYSVKELTLFRMFETIQMQH